MLGENPLGLCCTAVDFVAELMSLLIIKCLENGGNNGETKKRTVRVIGACPRAPTEAIKNCYESSSAVKQTYHMFTKPAHWIDENAMFGRNEG